MTRTKQTKKRFNKNVNFQNDQDENQSREKNEQSNLKYFINKSSLDNQETPPSTSNSTNNSKGFNFSNSSIPNSFNFNNNGSRQQLKWNGNKPNYLSTSKNHFNPINNNNNKDVGAFEPKKPLNKAMTNRYFSIENKLNDDSKVTEESDLNKEDDEQLNDCNNNKNDEESEQFIKKRDYLLKKLLQSRNLPEASATDNAESTELNLEITEKNAKHIESIEKINESTNSKPKALTTTPAFQDDFIPLFSTNKEKASTSKETHESSEENDENDYEEIVLESYDHDEKDEEDVIDLTNNNDDIIEIFNNVKKGPYPIKCLSRANKYLVDLIKPNSPILNKSNYEDRIFEILKLKLELPSKFDNDKRLLRQITRDSRAALEKIHEKLEYINRRANNFNYKSPKQTSTHIRFENNEKKHKHSKQPVYIELSDDSEDELNTSDDSTTKNFEDVIKMIQGNEFECLLESDDSNSDSRCRQLGKYSKKKSQLIKTKPSLDNKISTRLRKVPRPGSIKKRSEVIEHERGSNSNRLEDALDNLEQKYKSVRNKRNKLLRKKKGIEINAQRQIMSDELKVIRREMKKLRKKQRKDFYKPNTLTSNENSNFIPLKKCADIKLDQNSLRKKRKKNLKTNQFKKANRNF